MGLDITAYSRLEHVGHHEFDPADLDEAARRFWDSMAEAFPTSENLRWIANRQAGVS